MIRSFSSISTRICRSVSHGGGGAITLGERWYRNSAVNKHQNPEMEAATFEPVKAPATFEPVKENVRIIFNDTVIADTTNASLVSESDFSAYYIAPADLKMEHLTRVSGSSYCPWKGTASYWTLSVGDKKAESVAWSYEDPKEAFLPFKGKLAFYTDRVDGFYVGEKKV